ncbi:BTB/POZ domain-containing protein 19-like [Physella acuta]|uniref:BTB/POZ domain-containing protein 19-like n=1 Tax=Physella acuta TaxID=109671 RepID=UPI0027DC3998|nr:BTB/POZ domain-containing protein 19-like [Physella acuta]
MSKKSVSVSAKAKHRNNSSRDRSSSTTMAKSGEEEWLAADIEEHAKMMKKLINNTEFSDIKFLIGPSRKQIHAHRCILSARCAVFKAMFAEKPTAGDKEIPFVLSDMAPDIFLTMLEYIYTNCVTLSPKSALDVLATSLEYGLDGLRDLCVDYLENKLSVSNACDVMQAAVTYNQNDLKEKALDFIEDNTEEVFKSKSFQEISEDTLVSILRSNRLNMDEVDLYKAVKEWATISAVVNNKQLHEVARDAVKNIRLPLLTPSELKGLEEDNKKDHFIPVEHFASAWRVHALKEGDKENILSCCRRGTTPRDHHKYLSDNSHAA